MKRSILTPVITASETIFFQCFSLQNVSNIDIFMIFVMTDSSLEFYKTTLYFMTIWSRMWNKVIWYDIHVLLYKYWLHERLTWEIVIPRKPMSTEAKPRLTLVFEGWQFAILSLKLLKHNQILFFLARLIVYHTPPFLLANIICEKCWTFFFWLETYRSTSWIIKHRDCWYP